MIRFIKNIDKKNIPFFSTNKQYDKGLLKVYKQKLDQSIGGHLIYQTQKSKSFLLTGLAILSGLGLSVTIYQIQGNWNNFIPLLICIASTIFYQRRLFNTVRKIVIEKSGQDMKIQRYGLLGSEFMGSTLVTPIYLMRGISKRSINRGVVMQGGGKYGYDSFKYYFHSEGVKDKTVFDAVMSGTCIKYVDKF